MGSLYIGGAQCMHAQMNDMWEEFDTLKGSMSALAEKFDVCINRYSIEEFGDPEFVISNKPVSHKCFYSSSAFKYDMSFEISDTFEQRAKEFIKALDSNKEFSAFHSLSWSEPKQLYFVTS